MKKIITLLFALCAVSCMKINYNPPSDPIGYVKPYAAFGIREIDHTYVVFQDRSTGDSIVYDFGDGAKQKIEPCRRFGHLYDYSGTYTVTCTAYGGNETDERKEQVTVEFHM